MTKFYFTDANIKRVISSLVSKMLAKGISMLEVSSLSGMINLPSGGFILLEKVRVFLTCDQRLIIKPPKKEGYEYPLDDCTLLWIKQQRIPIYEFISKI